MSIHKTISGTFEVRWRNKGRQRSKTFKRKIDAEKFEAKILLDQVPDFLNESKETRSPEITFGELAEIWMRDHAEVHKAASSLVRDRQILKTYLLPQLGKYRLSAITRLDIVQLQAKLYKSGKIGAKTVNNIIGLCHKIFFDGLGWGYNASNPAAGVKPIKCQEVEHRFWSFDERDRFLTYVRSRNRALYDLVAFAVHTGLRRGEVEALARDCIDFERREIIVKRNFCHKTNMLNEYTKGKTIRRVPINEVVMEVLGQYRLLPPNQRIFRHDFQHIVKRYLVPLQREAGVSEITFHDLRHTFASHLAMSGVSVFDIQKLLGHSDIKTTMRYMHMAPDHLQGVTDVLMRGRRGSKTSENESVREKFGAERNSVKHLDVNQV